VYRDFFESLKTLFKVLLGSNNLGSLRLINPYLAPVFFYLYILIMVMVVLSMFVAVVNSSYEDSRELLAEPNYCFCRDTLWLFTVDAETLLPVRRRWGGRSRHKNKNKINMKKGA
jgi:hypothetical protein